LMAMGAWVLHSAVYSDDPTSITRASAGRLPRSASTGPARSDDAMQTLAPESSRMYSISFGCSLAFIGTAVRPACQAAYQISTYCGQLLMASATRSPGIRPNE